MWGSLKPGGLLSFLTLAVGEGLRGDERTQAIEAGPEFVAAEDTYPNLLERAGFVNFEVADVSDEFTATIEAYLREGDREKEGLEGLLGAEEHAENQRRLEVELEAARAGQLRRLIVSAGRP
ncbi:MAG: hypothetical protein U9N56_09465 [Actinomycetota bacterium]|nr:hypothetical protein [Actinomycetota bacterium]